MTQRYCNAISSQRVKAAFDGNRLILLIYLAAYLLYAYGLHTELVGTPIDYFWQYLDPRLLQNDLGSSLFYLHAQPPLMNLIIGIILKLAPMHVVGVLTWFYFLVGFAAVYFLNEGLALLDIRYGIRLVIISWLCFFPTFPLFAHWAYTTHLEFLLCCILLYFLAQLQRQLQNKSCLTRKSFVKLGIPFCLLGLLHAQWHPAVFMVWAGFVWFLLRRFSRFADYVSGAVITMSPLLLLFLKNFLLFGLLGVSSWGGMNLAGVVKHIVSPEEIRSLKDSGEISPWFPVNFYAAQAQAVYDRHVQQGKAISIDHPSLALMKSNHRGNFNFKAFIAGDKQDMADSLAIIRHYPSRYVHYTVQKMLSIAGVPSIAFDCCFFTLENVHAIGIPYSRVAPAIQGWIEKGSILLYGVIPLLVLLYALLPRGYVAGLRFFVLSGMFLTIANYMISCAVIVLEQERVRWAMEPFYLAYCSLLLEVAVRWVISLRGRYSRLRKTCSLRSQQIQPFPAP